MMVETIVLKTNCSDLETYNAEISFSPNQRL